MKKKLSLEVTVGLFTLGTILLVVFMTVGVSERSLFRGGDYTVNVMIDSAEGLTKKTPVEVAGIQVGFVKELELHEGRRAKVQLQVSRQVRLGQDAKAQVRTKGFLGQTYIDLLPGVPSTGLIGEGGEITATNPFVDLGQIAQDVREVTNSLKKMLADDGEAPVSRIFKNIETFTQKLSEMTVQNQENVNEIVANLKTFSSDLSEVIADRKEGLKETMQRLNSITRKVDEGRGTLGRLVNDTEVADSVSQAAKGISETVGGINRFQIDMGYHLEYLGKTREFKNYAGVALRPRPDKFFLVEFVVDPSPTPVITLTDTIVTTGGTSTTVSTDRAEVQKNKFLMSAQLAKTFYNVTLRGGVIESRGGLGVDYALGPMSIQFSAFDFRNDHNLNPHLKLMGKLDVTKNFFLVSGMDDLVAHFTKQRTWFIGGGLQLVDNDLRSLLGAARLR